jgi:glycosyltransferase involved in cell wall biosynthesis
MTGMSLVSICIPTYNGEKFLRLCLESALSQTYGNIEIVIVDDTSNDNSHAIAQEYAGKDSRIRIFRNERNLGLVGNWNQCVLLAQGEWVKFLFQDDLLEPQHVEELLAMARGRNIAVVGCFRKFLFEPGTTHETQQFYLNNRTLIEQIWRDTALSAEDIAKFALSNVGVNFFGEPTVSLIHRDVFGAIGYFDPALAMRCDTEFWVRAGINFGLLMVRKDLATFRVHKRSTSSRNYSGNQFSDKYIDLIIILHHYLFDEKYKPLRKVASEVQLAKKLEQEFWDRCHCARSMVFEAEGPEAIALRELWTSASKFYSKIDNIPLSRRITRRWRNISQLLRAGATPE